MAWFKVDDGLHASRKFQSIPKRARFAAVGVWTIAGSWSADQLTDGFVPDYMLELWGSPPSAPSALVEAGLWDRTSGGYLFCNWLEYQPRKADVDAEREASRARMRDLRAKRKQAKAHDRADKSDMFGRTDTNGSENVRNPDPTRPDPTPSSKEDEGTAKRGGVRGTRVPDTFEITPDMHEWAAENVPLVDVDKKLGEWLDYWRSVPGQKGVKLDWVSTWRNGMRKQQQFAERDAPKAGAGDSNEWMNRSTWK